MTHSPKPLVDTNVDTNVDTDILLGAHLPPTPPSCCNDLSRVWKDHGGKILAAVGVVALTALSMGGIAFLWPAFAAALHVTWMTGGILFATGSAATLATAALALKRFAPDWFEQNKWMVLVFTLSAMVLAIGIPAAHVSAAVLLAHHLAWIAAIQQVNLLPTSLMVVGGVGVGASALTVARRTVNECQDDD